jgi:hypothetical protein
MEKSTMKTDELKVLLVSHPGITSAAIVAASGAYANLFQLNPERTYEPVSGPDILHVFINCDVTTNETERLTTEAAFLERYGMFNGIGRVVEGEFAEWQAIVRAMLSQPLPVNLAELSKFLNVEKLEFFESSPIPLRVQLSTESREGAPFEMQIIATNILDAVIAQVKLDRIRGEGWATCASPRCTTWFKIADEDHVFCSDECHQRELAERAQAA